MQSIPAEAAIAFSSDTDSVSPLQQWICSKAGVVKGSGGRWFEIIFETRVGRRCHSIDSTLCRAPPEAVYQLGGVPNAVISACRRQCLIKHVCLAVAAAAVIVTAAATAAGTQSQP
jgi:hypothetical protein